MGTNVSLSALPTTEQTDKTVAANLAGWRDGPIDKVGHQHTAEVADAS